MNTKKIIAIDLDGTLLHLNKDCPKKSRKYLKQLKEEGHIIVIATGRTLKSIKEITKNVSFANYIIGNNGTFIYDCQKKKIIFNSIITKENILKICSLYNQDAIKCIELMDLNYYYKYTKEDIQNTNLTKKIENETMLNNISNKICRINILFKENIKIETWLKQISKLTKDLSFDIMEDSFSINKWIGANNKNITKYSSIKQISKIEQIDNENIIAFGDGLNDIDMLKKSGIGVAMNNALPEVKKVCKYQTKTNEEDGVIYFLNKYLKEKINI